MERDSRESWLTFSLRFFRASCVHPFVLRLSNNQSTHEHFTMSTIPTSAQQDIIKRILVERQRQNSIWGGPKHDDARNVFDWYHTITYQFSKVFLSKCTTERATYTIHLAAVCIAALEAWGRNASRCP